jgi:hypothetical protein
MAAVNPARSIAANPASLLGLGLALIAPASSEAAVRGELGPQSHATVGISVSVSPRFEVKHFAASDRSPGSSAPSMQGASNAPGLRYTVLVYPAANPEAVLMPRNSLRARHEFGGTSETGRRVGGSLEAGVLFMIVPD